MIKYIVCMSVLFILCLSVTAPAQSDSDKVKVSALANGAVVVPGHPFWVAFKFKIDPGWHIYWKNPGDSGLPTQVKLTLPEGFTAGELQFPVPQRLVQPGDVVNYGYEDEVTLLMEVTPPKDLPATGTVKIGAKANWLVCKEDCVPGSVKLSIELPAGDTPTPANQDLFKDWSSKLPVAIDPDIADWSKASSITDGNGTCSIDINWKTPASDIHFIPGAMKTGDISDVKVTTAANATRIAFSVKDKKDQTPITGLVSFTKANGTKTALDVSFPAVKLTTEASPMK